MLILDRFPEFGLQKTNANEQRLVIDVVNEDIASNALLKVENRLEMATYVDAIKKNKL